MILAHCSLKKQLLAKEYLFNQDSDDMINRVIVWAGADHVTTQPINILI